LYPLEFANRFWFYGANFDIDFARDRLRQRITPERLFEKYKIAHTNPRDPPQPPLKRGEPDPIPPFLRGVRGDL
jgi:hypothetical protein